MRYVAGAVATLLVAVPALAQPNFDEVPEDAVVRGCVVDNRMGAHPELGHRGLLLLRALDSRHQTFDAALGLTDGTLFSLTGGRELLEELAVVTDEAIEVTGELRRSRVKVGVVRPPPGAGVPGFPGQPPLGGGQRVMGRVPPSIDDLEVMEYKRWPFECGR